MGGVRRNEQGGRSLASLASLGVCAWRLGWVVRVWVLGGQVLRSAAWHWVTETLLLDWLERLTLNGAQRRGWEGKAGR